MPKKPGYESLLRAILVDEESNDKLDKIFPPYEKSNKKLDKSLPPLPIDKTELIRVWQKKRRRALDSFDNEAVIECDLKIDSLRKEIAMEIMAEETQIENELDFPDSVTIPLEVLKERLVNFYVNACLQGQEDFKLSFKELNVNERV